MTRRSPGRPKDTAETKRLRGTTRRDRPPRSGARPRAPQPRTRKEFDLGVLESMLGHPLPAGTNPYVALASRDAWQERWRLRGAEALKLWLRDNAPGTRPPSWWRFCAPGRRARRPLDAPPRPERESIEQLVERTAKPITFMLEAEAAFLRRHGLLAPDEARRLHSEDYLPSVRVTRDGLSEDYCVDPEVLSEVGP